MGVMTSLDATKLYERIANMMLLQVAHAQIAETMGVAVEIIEQIKNREDFNVVFARVNEQFEAQLEIDTDWDSVEARALKILTENLMWNKDPEFALKAASVSNKAVRRNRTNGNQPLPAKVGTRINISLSGGFVEQMQVLDGESTEVTVEKDEPEPTGLLGLVKKSKGEIEDQQKFDDLVSPATLKNMFNLTNKQGEMQSEHFFNAQLDTLLADE